MKALLQGEAAQVAFGEHLGRAVGRQGLVFLHGDLGTGKTTLVRGFLRARGHQGAVKSPTYTLIEPYELPSGRVYHLDLYRLADPEELEYLGLREILAEDAVLLVEWPERGRGWLPPPDLELHLAYAADGSARRIELDARTPAGEAMLSRLSTT